MRKRRRKRDSAEFNIDCHIKKLGLSRVREYLDWCEINGFAREVDKSPEDRELELIASLSSGPAWQKINRRGLGSGPIAAVIGRGDREILESIIGGKIRYGLTSYRKYVSLCSAIERLRGASFETDLKVLQRLVDELRSRGSNLHEYSKNVKSKLPYQTCTLIEALAWVAKLKSKWIRPLSTWEHTDFGSNHMPAFKSLLSHLFVRHSIPEFLFNAWYHESDTRAQQDLNSFLHVADGHSIRTVEKSIRLSRKMSHHFMLAPKKLSLAQAVRWGQVRGLGGSEKTALAISRSFLGAHRHDIDFWNSVIEWIVKLRFMDDKDIGPVLDFLNNQRFGVGNPERIVVSKNGQRSRQLMPAAQPRLTMKGRTLVSVLRDVERWHRDLHLIGARTTCVWPASRIDTFQHTTRGGTSWTFEELTSNGALFEEGRMLSHCVGSYSQSCIDGKTTIWSMSCNVDGKRKRALTIQVNIERSQIVQVRGLANRLPLPEESHVIRLWAWESGLTWTDS